MLTGWERVLLQESDLGSWLRSVRGGSPTSVFTDHVDDTQGMLEELMTSEREPARVVTVSWIQVPLLGNELELLSNALAEATLQLYPHLYGVTQSPGERWAEADVETAAHEITRRVPGVHGPACREILRACRKRKRPTARGSSNTDQVRQLALAIEPQRLAISIAVKDTNVPAASLRALAQGTEWLATTTRARVVLVLPKALYGAPELDHVTYSACLFSAPGDAASEFLAPKQTIEKPLARSQGAKRLLSEPNVTVSPVLGKPHPRSEAEKELYERICADAELCQLFAFNQRVETRFESTPTVDLISFQHKLVIEIDGDDHRQLWKWAADRKRDVELFLSGYRVMRFTTWSLLENMDLVLSRIRDAVTLLQGQENI